MKKVSVSSKIVSYINKHGPQKSSALIAALNVRPNRVYNEVYKLIKAGRIVKLNDKTFAVNGFIDSGDSRMPSFDAEKRQPSVGWMERRIKTLEDYVDNLEGQVSDYSVKCLDALAVVRYLESKITFATTKDGNA